jgi:hypothetical protein
MPSKFGAPRKLSACGVGHAADARHGLVPVEGFTIGAARDGGDVFAADEVVPTHGGALFVGVKFHEDLLDVGLDFIFRRNRSGSIGWR